MLTDPEGNEFCVIEPHNAYLAGCGSLGELACEGTREVGLFWAEVLRWPLVWDQDQETAVQSPNGGTKLAWGGPPVATKLGRSRQRLELTLIGDDMAAEVDRLVRVGASLLGSVDEGAVEMADADGKRVPTSARLTKSRLGRSRVPRPTRVRQRSGPSTSSPSPDDDAHQERRAYPRRSTAVCALEHHAPRKPGAQLRKRSRQVVQTPRIEAHGAETTLPTRQWGAPLVGGEARGRTPPPRLTKTRRTIRDTVETESAATRSPLDESARPWSPTAVARLAASPELTNIFYATTQLGRHPPGAR